MESANLYNGGALQLFSVFKIRINLTVDAGGTHTKNHTRIFTCRTPSPTFEPHFRKMVGSLGSVFYIYGDNSKTNKTKNNKKPSHFHLHCHFLHQIHFWKIILKYFIFQYFLSMFLIKPWRTLVQCVITHFIYSHKHRKKQKKRKCLLQRKMTISRVRSWPHWRHRVTTSPA